MITISEAQLIAIMHDKKQIWVKIENNQINDFHPNEGPSKEEIFIREERIDEAGCDWANFQTVMDHPGLGRIIREIIESKFPDIDLIYVLDAEAKKS